MALAQPLDDFRGEAIARLRDRGGLDDGTKSQALLIGLGARQRLGETPAIARHPLHPAFRSRAVEQALQLPGPAQPIATHQFGFGDVRRQAVAETIGSHRGVRLVAVPERRKRRQGCCAARVLGKNEAAIGLARRQPGNRKCFPGPAGSARATDRVRPPGAVRSAGRPAASRPAAPPPECGVP